MPSIYTYMLASLLVGCFSFGGGKAYIPIFQNIYVDTFSLISSIKLTELVGYSVSLPGPIAPMIAGPVGFDLFGWTGFVLGLLSLTLVPLMFFIFAWTVYKKNSENKIVKRVTKYLNPAIIALLLFVCFDSVFTFKYGFNYLYYSIPVFILSSFILLKTSIHPIFVIIAGGTLGLFIL